MASTVTTAPTHTTASTAPRKPHLSFLSIVNMNVGFFGIQYSFGLQQSNMSPIYRYLGADEASLPLLYLAGPVTGLIVQPIIGAMSDRTLSPRGRRTPYFLIGAFLCSLSLLAMPFSRTLWMAAGILWILDAANNITMEPYRAYVSDRLDDAQTSLGFLTQSAFTGLGQTLSYITPSLLVFLGMNRDAVNDRGIPTITMLAFLMGAVFSTASILWSLRQVPELPLTVDERQRIERMPRGVGHTLQEIVDALREMPTTMRQMVAMKFFQWYAMFCYWIYIAPALALTLFDTQDPASAGFREAGLVTGQVGAFYNFIAFVSAFAMVPVTRRIGAKWMHVIALSAASLAMLALPAIESRALLFVPMLGIGLAWGSMMGNPYVMLSDSIPKERVGVYMGVFNMFIVIPMLIQNLTLPLFYETLLGGNPANVIRLAGALLGCAAVACAVVSVRKARVTAA
ncbi:MFS transporter [Gemmatimonas sp.]|jgi:maltose/moltooligosaccharide transporter|uniref:MFS transporter n=1 Tax=Gemmatimonas sp. TaxID=1962908 RepID=UPI0037BE7127